MTEKRVQVRTKNWKFIWVREEEVELFEQIWLHRTMQAKSIHAVYQETSNTLRHSNAISNRLTKLVEHELLIRLTKDVSVTRARVPRYYYRLVKKGLRLLAQQKRIVLDEQTRKEYRSYRQSPVSSNHTDAMSILANQIYLGCRNKVPGMTHCRDAAGKITLSSGKEQFIREMAVEPDWIFQVNERLLCIELDTGTQGHADIKGKFAKYEALQLIGQKTRLLSNTLEEVHSVT